jgi:tRNA 2-thiouridine synthesizing protein C
VSSILFVFSKAPHGSINAQEGVDALLMGTAFAQCSVLFIGDGVAQLIKHQAPETIGMKNFSRNLLALQEYGVQRATCAAKDLSRLGLVQDDLVIAIEPLEDEEIQTLINNADKVLNF